MADAAYGMLASLLTMLVVAGYTVLSRLRGIRRARSAIHEPPLSTPRHLGRRSAPRDYKSNPATNSTGMRLFLDRMHAEREERRRKQREFQAWLEITSEPL